MLAANAAGTITQLTNLQKRRCEVRNLTAKSLKIQTCGTWGRVVEPIPSDVSEVRISHIFRVKQSKTIGM